MQNGPYTFNSRPMILKNWTPDFQTDDEPMRIVPIWVTFPRRPSVSSGYQRENMGLIASYLGKPVCTDKLTASCEMVSYARMLIEMDITQVLPDVLVIEQQNGELREQEIEYEWHPKLCHECHELGHLAEECKARGEANENMPKKKKKAKRKKKQDRAEWQEKATDLAAIPQQGDREQAGKQVTLGYGEQVQGEASKTVANTEEVAAESGSQGIVAQVIQLHVGQSKAAMITKAGQGQSPKALNPP
ncbi:uncharacterized protein LOC132057613 [Lycium ferocissimum]|uniref:uncharacterized protein LOC132057613 n=1 Tax=Lycium ferocissimum TaxID=112874 RepID=UPI0028158495|nr:uncharacterized protein LOC132057613 [Lycium ferocissimum]